MASAFGSGPKGRGFESHLPDRLIFIFHNTAFYNPMKRQMHIFYSGRVQGVGFRFAARQIAHDTGACGWVKNLPDGRVELVLEAEEAVLKAFFKKINQSFSYYIRDYELEWFEASGEFKNFSIEF